VDSKIKVSQDFNINPQGSVEDSDQIQLL